MSAYKNRIYLLIIQMLQAREIYITCLGVYVDIETAEITLGQETRYTKKRKDGRLSSFRSRGTRKI